jgi:CheY-like chemotaxis protein
MDMNFLDQRAKMREHVATGAYLLGLEKAAVRQAGGKGRAMQHSVNAPSSILVVDDDPQTRDVMVKILEDQGHLVTAAETSFVCLDLLSKGATFHLIIIDIVMPPSTPHGFALGRMIRVSNRQQKLLYISGQVEMLPSRELSGANAPVLPKPIHAAELQDAVRRVLAE